MVKPPYKCPRRHGGGECQFTLGADKSICMWCARGAGVRPLVAEVEVALGAELIFELDRAEIVEALTEYLQRRKQLGGDFDATLRATHIGGVISHAVVALVRKA